MQFWDKDSFVDGPIRSVLHMLEKEYPFQISELIRFLSAVCHGTWPAHCVYVVLFSFFIFWHYCVGIDVPSPIENLCPSYLVPR